MNLLKWFCKYGKEQEPKEGCLVHIEPCEGCGPDKPPVAVQLLQEKARIWQEGYRAARRDLGTYYYGKPNPTTPNPYNGREPNSDRVDKNYLGWEKL